MTIIRYGYVDGVSEEDKERLRPRYATPEAACFDLFAYSYSFEVFDDGEESGAILCRTGLIFDLSPGTTLLIYSRSGHGFKYGLRLANCVGVIDSDYRGEVMVKLHHDRPGNPLPRSYFDSRSAIAQARIVQAPHAKFIEVDEDGRRVTERSDRGFGSTDGVS